MIDNEFEELLLKAKNNNEDSIIKILDTYRNVIRKYSLINGKIDSDLKQDLICKTIEVIKKFEI